MVAALKSSVAYLEHQRLANEDLSHAEAKGVREMKPEHVRSPIWQHAYAQRIPNSVTPSLPEVDQIYKHAFRLIDRDEQMVTAHFPKSLKEAKLPRALGSVLGSFTDWKANWREIHLGELFREDLSLTEYLFEKGPSHDVFRALVGLQSQGDTEDIVQYVTHHVAAGTIQRPEKVRKYLDDLAQRATQQEYGFFTYSTETGLWGIAVHWTGGGEAGLHGSLQETALSALRSGNPCSPKV